MVAYKTLFTDLLESRHSMDTSEEDINTDIRETDCEESIKSSEAISHVRCIKETDVSRTISVLIIRDVI
jgi:hypothetical protein